MIAILVDLFKSFSKPFDQDKYDAFIRELARTSLRKLVCLSCREKGRHGHLIRWCFHERSVSADCETRIKAKLQRIRCTECDGTHSLFPESIVPFSTFPVQLQINVIQLYLDDNKDSLQKLFSRSICQGNALHIYRRFIKEWKDRLRETDSSIGSPIREIAEKCISSFQRQFMQTADAPVFCYGFLLQKIPDHQKTTGS